MATRRKRKMEESWGQIMNEFEQDKKINPGQLDVEAVQQADLFYKWAEKSVEAKTDLNKANLQLDLLEAELQLKCRDKPEEFGLSKITEKGVDTAVKRHGAYIDARKECIEAQRISSLLDKAVMAMEQKKRMIEVLVTLHGQQYFAGPSVPRDLVSEFQEHQKNVSESVNNRQGAAGRNRRNKDD